MGEATTRKGVNELGERGWVGREGLVGREGVGGEST